MTVTFAFEDPKVCQNLVFKPSMRCLDLANMNSEAAIQSRKVFSRSNSFLSVLDVPHKMAKLNRSIISLSFYGSLGECVEIMIDIFKKFTSLLSIFATSLQIAHQEGFLSLSKNQFFILDVVGFTSSLALFLKSISEVNKNFTQLRAARVGGYAFNLAFLKFIGRICGVVTGIFGMLTFAFGGGIHAKWAILAVSTITLSISISKYYLKSLYSDKNQQQ